MSLHILIIKIAYSDRVLCFFPYYRSTSTATVYHLLQRKLKKYCIRHPEKAKLNTNTETVAANTVSAKDFCGTVKEKENRNTITMRHECTVAREVVFGFDGNEEKTQNGVKESVSKELEASINRNRLSSASLENLSAPKEKFTGATNRSLGDTDFRKLETCNIVSSAGIKISRKDSCSYSSVDVMAVKVRSLSLNLSHISVESKVTGDELKHTSAEKLNEHGGQEMEKNETKDKMGSPRFSDAMAAITLEKTQKSSRNTCPNTRSEIGKVSVITSSVVSIPLQHTRQASLTDKVISYRYTT